MSKKLKIYQILTFALGLAFVGLCLFVGITAVQKSMKLNLGFQVNPSFECKIVYNGNTIFCNTTKNGESLIVGNGVSLNGNNLTLNQNFSGLGAEFTLTIHNYTALKTEISVSGTGANGDTLTLDAYSSGTAPNGNITITATGTSATLTFAEWRPIILFVLNNCDANVTNGVKLEGSGSYSITFTPHEDCSLPTSIVVQNVESDNYEWDSETGVLTILDVSKITQSISVEVNCLSFLCWSGNVAESFAGGSGTENDPYLISNGEELALIAQSMLTSPNHYAGNYFLITDDIYLNVDYLNYETWESTPPTNVWTSIGGQADNVYLEGNLDGGNHTIYGIYGGALFGAASGEISNIKVSHSYVSSAGILSRSKGGASINYCSIENSIVVGDDCVGGIVGYTSDYGDTTRITLKGCSNSATIIATGACVGGILGDGTSSSAQLDLCVNSGKVTGANSVGGIIGFFDGGSITNCKNTAVIVGTDANAYVGELCGQKWSGSLSGNTTTYDDIPDIGYDD